jgi:hypothetical protein
MMQVVNIATKSLPGSVELTFRPLTPQDEEFGWTLSNTTIQVPSGESRPLQIGLKPSQALAEALKVVTLAEHKELILSAQVENISYTITVHATVK